MGWSLSVSHREEIVSIQELESMGSVKLSHFGSVDCLIRFNFIITARRFWCAVFVLEDEMAKYRMGLDEKAIGEIENVIGYRFQNKGLLIQAFTRSSFRNEHPEYPDNEVLELMGDSVLSLSVLTYFKNTYAKNTPKGLLTDWDEGKLSALKNALVNKKQLAARMEQLGLQKYLLLSRGDIASGITQEASVKEDLFESILGAVYVDAEMNFERASAVVRQMLDIGMLVEQSAQRVHISYRNDLQEWCQHKKRKFQAPVYTEKQLADDDFRSTVSVSEIGMSATGSGKNMKYAREEAAKLLLQKLSEYSEDAFFSATVQTENHVGKLQELVQKAGHTSADIAYADTKDEILSDGNHRFTVTCTYLDRQTHGTGNSKKEAKQNAAQMMLKHV